MRVVHLSFVFLLFFIFSCEKTVSYSAYALRYAEGFRIPATDMIAGAPEEDSVDVCNMFWLLQDGNGRNILVDAGYIDSTNHRPGYIRPDSLLERIGIEADEISDIIITHPHNDHIGGISLFPLARLWMQEDDYNYFCGPAWEEGGQHFGFRQRDVLNLQTAAAEGRLNLIRGDSLEFLPGIIAFTGSKHTFDNQFLLVRTVYPAKKLLLASDAAWFTYNIENKMPALLCMDPEAYLSAMERMTRLIPDTDRIIPGHDNRVFDLHPEVVKGVVELK